MKAYIIHKAEAWNNTSGSLLLLFKEFGYKIWLNPRQIENYNELNHFDNHHEQEIVVLPDIEEMIKIGIEQQKHELLKYKKRR
ncbi:unnamed protein product [marine sediment metagenome]|uniref:Uncharacterized protein n=1 Tax=marine sediment metagenome TaxID=412755 RepID=X0WI40_9ZZZZ